MNGIDPANFVIASAILSWASAARACWAASNAGGRKTSRCRGVVPMRCSLEGRGGRQARARAFDRCAGDAVTVRMTRCAVTDDRGAVLLAGLHAECEELYGPNDEISRYPGSDFDPPDGVFLVVEENGRTIA